jgi:hypothetical protein
MSILRHKIDVSNAFRLNPTVNESKVTSPMKLQATVRAEKLAV